jgi:uncharacterized protein (TIGR02452 family)
MVFKAAEEQDWAPMEPIPFAFIACPALKRPGLIDGRLSDGDADTFKKKMRLVLQTAYLYGHDTVILGAWGTGAWCCPPTHVAELFAEVLADCDGAFRTVCFAIKTTPDTREGNRFSRARDAFSRVLEGSGAAPSP